MRYAPVLSPRLNKQMTAAAGAQARLTAKVRNAVPAWRLSACLSAHSILGLPAGTVEKTGTRPGDELLIEKLT